MTESTRAYIYRVLTAAVPILVAYGAIAEADVAMWLGLVGAVLGAGGHALASANSETKKSKAHWDHDDHVAAVAYAAVLAPEDHPLYGAELDGALQACGIENVREAAELIGADPDEVS